MDRANLLVGLVAGAAAAVLYAAAGTGSMLSFALFYIATLPLFIVGLGWGWQASIAAIIAGTLATGMLGGQTASIMFLLAFALPSGWLCYLSLLYQDAGDENSPGTREWYPVGRILCWVAAIGAGLTIASIFFYGGSVEGFSTFVHNIFGPLLLQIEEAGAQPAPDQQTIEDFLDLLVQLLPIMLVSSWMTVTFANLYGGGKIAMLSGRLARPWPNLWQTEIPARFSLVPIGAFILSFFGGWTGLAATIVMTAAIIAYAIQGLSVLHSITRGASARIAILILAYGSVIVLAFPALLLAALGLAEPMFNLRARAEKTRNRPPPTNT